jgi:hypothetical protein
MANSPAYAKVKRFLSRTFPYQYVIAPVTNKGLVVFPNQGFLCLVFAYIMLISDCIQPIF